MNDQHVEVIIGPTGLVKIEAKGFTGAGCKDATSLLERAFGGGETSLKPEYHETENDKIRLTEGY